MALDLTAFGQLLRERRLAARLSQAKLAKLAGLTEVTIRNAENAHNAPSEDTLRRLLEVRELGLVLSNLPTLRLYELENDLEFYRKLNWFIAPDYEVLKLWLDFRKQLTSDAGHIDQTYLYLDAESAADYVRMASDHAAVYRQSVPTNAIAQEVMRHVPHRHLDVIALGPGDGEQETRLVQSLVAADPDRQLRFHLLDISQPLLNVAYRYATDALSHHPNVFIAGMQGNFYDLPSYQHIFYIPKTRPTTRLFVIFGGTLGNIDNETRFFRHSLAIANEGDMVLLAVRPSFVQGELSESAIRRADPAFLKPVSPLHARWLGGPIRRYCQDVVETTFRYEIRLDCVVPGSYAMDAIGKVSFRDGGSRNISMCRFKSYDTKKFADCLDAEGWELVKDLPCGTSDTMLESFMLLRYRGPAADPSTT
jgi:transcriptional regulator with XRE-family HTH domain